MADAGLCGEGPHFAGFRVRRHVRHLSPERGKIEGHECEVAAAVENVLSHPCKLVVKAQSHGCHLMLSQAIHSIALLEVQFKVMHQVSPSVPPTTGIVEKAVDEQAVDDEERQHEVEYASSQSPVFDPFHA